MEPSREQNANSKVIENFAEIVKGLNDYMKDRSKVQVWNKIFWVLDIYLGKDGPLSSQAQKYVNFYIQNKSQTGNLKALVNQHKQLICKIFDICLSSSDSIDDALSTGALHQNLMRKLQKSLQQQNANSPKIRLIKYCVEAVALHFCEFLRKSKQQNGINIFYTNRKIPKIIKRKIFIQSTDYQLITQIFDQPVTLLDGFIDNVKPILTNYLNIESLFQVTSRCFRSKKAFLCGFVSRSDGAKQFIGKVLNINTIFDSSYAGRQMIQNKLASITLCQQNQANGGEKWSLITCIHQLQPKINAIIQKLPIFLKPKSNGDVLSFCRKQILPAFMYQVIKPGYVQRPIFIEYPHVFLNVGKNPFQILSFPYSNEVVVQLQKYQNENIYQIIDKMNTKYSKVKVNPKCIAVVPGNHYYVVGSNSNQKNSNALIQILFWNTLPKYQQAIQPTIKALQEKKKLFSGYFFLPIEYIFLDFINHEYLKTNTETLQLLKTYLSAKLKHQQDILSKHFKMNEDIMLEMVNINYIHRFCSHCKTFFFNYCCKTNNKKQYLCMSCSLTLQQGENIEEVIVFHSPNIVRYPLTLLSIYLAKKKHPSQNIQNVYEKNICNGQFCGSFQNQTCKGQPSSNTKNLNNFFINYERKDELFFSNRIKQLGITTIQQMIISLACKRPKTIQQKQMILEKLKIYSKQLSDPQSIKKIICHKYDQKNMVTQALWLLKTNQLFA